MRASRFASFASLLLLIGCAVGTPPRADAGSDAQMVWPDSGLDAGEARDDAGEPGEDGGELEDAGARDAGAHEGDGGEPDGGGLDGGLDGGGVDGGPVDGGSEPDAHADGGTCGVISAGHTIALDGVDDLARYPTSQVLTPGAVLEEWDRFGLTWDADYLYVSMVSRAFEAHYKPLHVYVEAASAFGGASASFGKAYSELTPVLPFEASHLIAVRRVTDSGEGGPYNGVYTAASGWITRETALEPGVDTWVAADEHTISARIPWSALGCPSVLRLSAHVVNEEVANEWKDLVPASATPWAAPGGGYYEIDLGGDPAISGWVER
jgi:hypothetical protein